VPGASGGGTVVGAEAKLALAGVAALAVWFALSRLAVKEPRAVELAPDAGIADVGSADQHGAARSGVEAGAGGDSKPDPAERGPGREAAALVLEPAPGERIPSAQPAEPARTDKLELLFTRDDAPLPEVAVRLVPADSSGWPAEGAVALLDFLDLAFTWRMLRGERGATRTESLRSASCPRRPGTSVSIRRGTPNARRSSSSALSRPVTGTRSGWARPRSTNACSTATAGRRQASASRCRLAGRIRRRTSPAAG